MSAKDGKWPYTVQLQGGIGRHPPSPPRYGLGSSKGVYMGLTRNAHNNKKGLLGAMRVSKRDDPLCISPFPISALMFQPGQIGIYGLKCVPT